MSSSSKPRGGGGDGDDRRSSRPSHRPRDRREESPRQRRHDHYEPRGYRDRRSPDSTRRRHNEHKEKREANTNTNSTQQPPSNPHRNLYPKSSIQRDNLASSKIRQTIPRRGPPTQQEKERAKTLPSANELKTKIRDVKRLLARGDGKKDMPADLRIEKERALIGYQRDLEEVEEIKKRSEMISKYHFVRFLERKRATKDLNRALQTQQTLQQKTTSTTTTLTAAATKVHEARVSLNYTIYCPLNQKYISLYPNSKEHDNKHKNNEYLDSDPNSLMLRNKSGEKPPLWGVVERCMLEDEEEGDGDGEGRRRLEELRDGKVGIEFGGGKGGKNKAEDKDVDVDMEEGGMSLPVVGGRKKPGTFGVGNGNGSGSGSGSLMVGGKKPGSFGVGKTEVKKEKKNKTGGDVEMGDGGEESDGGFFE